MLTEDKAHEILIELIRKPDSQASDIPDIWSKLIQVNNTAFAPLAEPAPKKRRRKATNPNIGWPAGVKRDEYKAWKAKQEAAGVTEGVNPQEFKRQRNAGAA